MITLSIAETNKTITIRGERKNFTIKKTDERYKLIQEILKNPNSENWQIYKIIDPRFTIKTHISEMFDIDEAGNCIIDNVKIPESIGTRIIKGIKLGEPINHIIRLWNNIMDNPDPRARSDLYKYLIHNEHPITPDGCFIAYRKVKRSTEDPNKLVDSRTKSFDNSPGKTVTMKREECDSDPNVTCSRGLHAASWVYIPGYPGDVVINIKVNPKDVVAIPVDYDERKLRCCEFKVLEINTIDKPLTGVTYHDGDILYSDQELPIITDFSVNKEHEKEYSISKTDTKENWKTMLRDSKGRFIKQLQA